MGQKVNPNIYQLGKTKIWSTKYSEKKLSETFKYCFKNVELDRFVFKFFKTNNLLINHYKVAYSENSLFIFVSYFNNFKVEQVQTTVKKKKINPKIHFPKKIKRKKVSFKKIFCSKKRRALVHFIGKYVKKRKSAFNVKQHFFLKNRNLNQTKKLNQLKEKIRFNKREKKKRFAAQLEKRFLNQFFINLLIFFKEIKKIILTFSPVNGLIEKKRTKKEIEFVNKNLNKLKIFNNNSYFNEGINIIILVLTQNKTINILTEYISTELQNHKKQHFFLNFIKKALEVFNKKEFCTPKNIKIIVKGRFNGVPRSKKRIIRIGFPISVISSDTKVYYSQETSFSENGTFGIKTWISEKTETVVKKNVTRTKKIKIQKNKKRTIKKIHV